VADIFQEVDEEVRREQLQKLWQRYGHFAIAGCILIVVAVGGWRGYDWWQAKKAAESGAAFEAAVALAETGKHQEAEAAFAKLATDGTASYRTLARLREAAELARTDKAAAVKAYDDIAADKSAGLVIDELAALRAAFLLVDTAPYSEIRARLEPLRERFQYILLDCPPSLGPLTVCALVAADRVIVPVQTEYFALEGLAGLLDTLAVVQRELNPRLTVSGMLLTMHDSRTRLGQDVEREVRAHFSELVFSTVIPRNVRVGEAPSYGLPVTHHDPYSAGAGAYFELAKEVAARG